MIPREDWKWHGMAGHFIGAASCCWHLVTDIGQVRVTSIGCYHGSNEEKSYATRKQIGAGNRSFYETFVFPIDPDGQPDEGQESAQAPITDLTEIDGERSASEAEAEATHIRYCEKWAALDGAPVKARA